MQDELRQKFEEIIDGELSGMNAACLGGHYGELVNICQEAYNLALEDKWISVKDRLPKNMEHILLYTSDKGRYTGHLEMYENYIINEEWCIGDYCYPLKSVTHWMPLPHAPKIKRS